MSSIVCGGQSGLLALVEYLIAANMLTAVISPLTKKHILMIILINFTSFNGL